MRSDVVNSAEIRVIGMSRSGNHCVINWVLNQAEGRYCFLNCAEGKTNPFDTARPLEDGSPVWTNISGFELASERKGLFVSKNLLVHSYEDSFLAHACSRWFDERHDALVGPSARRIDLLVLRDPFNLFASRRRLGAGLPRGTAVRMWKQHAKAFLGGSPHLRRTTVPVSYNEFVRSGEYRREIAGALGLTFSDRGLNRVAGCAGGSSFDGTVYDGEAWRMPVFERWKHVAGCPDYRTLMDPEVLSLAARIFPDRRLPHAELSPGASSVPPRTGAAAPSASKSNREVPDVDPIKASHNQNMTTAAKAQAERNILAQRS